MDLGAGDGARTYRGELNTTSVPSCIGCCSKLMMSLRGE